MNSASQSVKPTDQHSKEFYFVTPDDDFLIRALVFWDARHAEVQGKVIARPGYSGHRAPLAPREKLAILASRLASQYWEATMKSPKARVAYWHTLGRLVYPTLPRFQPGHRLPPTQSTHLHEIFKSLGRTATYVLAFWFAYWDTFERAEGPYRMPELEDLHYHSLDFVTRHWAHSIKEVLEQCDKSVVNAVLKRVRFDGTAWLQETPE